MQLREAKLVATPGCYPTASVLGAGAPGRKGPARRRRRQRDAGRLRRWPRRRRRDALRLDGRERLRLQDRGAPPPARDRAGAGGARQSRSGRLRPAPAAARPGRAGQLLRADDRAREQGPGAGALPRALRRRALRPCRRQPAWPARPARHQRVPHLRHRRGARSGDGLLGDRQPLEGRLRPGGPEPQPDARPRRDGGADCERAFLQIALGRGAGRGGGARPRPAGARLPRRRRPLRAQGRRQDRRRPDRLRRRVGRLGPAADPQRLRRGADPGLPRGRRPRPDPRRRRQQRQRQRRDRRPGLRRRAGDVRAGGDGAGPRHRQRRRRRDRDDRRAAADRGGPARHRRGRRGPLRRLAAAPSPTRSPPPTAGPSAAR